MGDTSRPLHCRQGLANAAVTRTDIDLGAEGAYHNPWHEIRLRRHQIPAARAQGLKKHRKQRMPILQPSASIHEVDQRQVCVECHEGDNAD